MYEQDKTGQELNLPIGMSQRRHLGLDRVYINWSVCHTSTVRKDASASPVVVLGMPANRFNLYNFEHFVFQCTKNARPTRIAQLDIIRRRAFPARREERRPCGLAKPSIKVAQKGTHVREFNPRSRAYACLRRSFVKIPNVARPATMIIHSLGSGTVAGSGVSVKTNCLRKPCTSTS